MWFNTLTGFDEISPDQVRSNLSIEGDQLISKVNGKSYTYGNLTIPSLGDLRRSATDNVFTNNRIQLAELVGDVKAFHKDPNNAGAVFQAASQFNLLEMVSPGTTPEKGVGIYEYDLTQGPACAIACGAGTIYRNYLAAVNGRIGQTQDNQIDCLNAIGKYFNNQYSKLWKMTNGYVLPTEEGLKQIAGIIQGLNGKEYEDLKALLKIGVQWNTEVTIGEHPHLVTQVYCSALPVAYSNIPAMLWAEFAKLILEATYEATFYVALKNYAQTKNNKLFLTLVGGGAFGNHNDWIFDALRKAILKFQQTPLEVNIISYGHSHPEVLRFVNSF